VASWSGEVCPLFIFVRLPLVASSQEAARMTGDSVVLDRVRRDADRVVLCRCGGAGRLQHVAVEGPDGTEYYVRGAFTCTWNRPGPHEPLLPPRLT
jgi:hypothetical protein